VKVIIKVKYRIRGVGTMGARRNRPPNILTGGLAPIILNIGTY